MKEGRLFTPDLEAGCRNGVLRQWVMRQREVETGFWPPAALEEAEEIFLTNSWIGIRPVTAFAGRKLRTGAAAKFLAARYRAVTGLT